MAIRTATNWIAKAANPAAQSPTSGAIKTLKMLPTMNPAANDIKVPRQTINHQMQTTRRQVM